MKLRFLFALIALSYVATAPVFAQTPKNCFLEDFLPKDAVIPPFEAATKPTTTPTVTATISRDTIGKVSKYIFGNAIAVWCGHNLEDPVMVSQTTTLAPTLIRYPGGSWSNIFFWSGSAPNLPDTTYDALKNVYAPFTPQYGANNWPTTLDSYYEFRDKVGAQGLITVNYGYARYGRGKDPVADAAHYAADWVRYDGGRTKYWEIGNENGGPWECGYIIDTTKNQDHQPRVITGALYAKHFRVFADSMRAAAMEIGVDIYIGGQILHYDASGETGPNSDWNSSFFTIAADKADFYVMHNYFGGGASTASSQITTAASTLKQNASFIRQDMAAHNAPNLPIAVTEWNNNGPTAMGISAANGMQAVTLFNEMIKNNFGMSCRWLLVTGETGGMYYGGTSGNPPNLSPRPDYFYCYYLPQFTGDHMVRTVSSNSNILVYATRFSSGETGVVLVNKSSTSYTVRVDPTTIGVGSQYYVYSLTGTDAGEFSPRVTVNGVAPTGALFGPSITPDNIPAKAYPIDTDIKVSSPARSVQFIMLAKGSNIISSVGDEASSSTPGAFTLAQNYPNPFNPSTSINYTLKTTGMVRLTVFDVLGRQVQVLVNGVQSAGAHQVSFDARSLSGGMYFYRLEAGDGVITRKMTLVK
ncbi:MAG TPA: T9SS type A sorting domain-containing protein [Bacteroidota bacterium]|nr:T9SS type A sorting domain-containing protein [Bacteroidota bacterium]